MSTLTIREQLTVMTNKDKRRAIGWLNYNARSRQSNQFNRKIKGPCSPLHYKKVICYRCFSEIKVNDWFYSKRGGVTTVRHYHELCARKLNRI